VTVAGSTTTQGETDQTTAAGSTTQAGQNPGHTHTQPAADANVSAQTSDKPLFVAQTQNDLDAKFGQTREEGRLSVAKKYGFDSIEAFDTAAAAWKATADSQLTEAQKAEQKTKQVEAERDTLRQTLALSQMKDTAQAVATKIGLDPAKLDRVEQYRDKVPAEINPDGTVNAALVENSMTVFLAKNPEFKAPAVVIGKDGVPPEAGAETTTLDEQINAAQAKGDVNTLISLQMRKFFTPST
jgi:hypothetical protein